MRKAFINTLVELSERDERILLVAVDLGYTVVEPYQKAFPGRFVNPGVCEQNAVAMATGLAEAGFIPFVYSIAPFATARPYEFIRNGPALHQSAVRMVGVGGGFEYGPAGPTHFGIDDVGLMRLLTGTTIVTPADAAQAQSALRATWDLQGPVYYRLGKDDTYELPGLEGAFKLGSAQCLREGKDVCLISLGALARESEDACLVLEADGVQAGHILISSVEPFPAEMVIDKIAGVSLVVVAEAHVQAGGIGERIGTIIAENGLSCKLLRCNAGREWDGRSGSNMYCLERDGLTGTAIAAAIKDTLQSKNA
jgi:transketolase